MKYTRRIAGIDAECVGAKNVETFYKLNCFACELLCNSWLAMCDDLGVVHRDSLSTVIELQGIIPTIRQCSNDADLLIGGEQPSDLGLLLVKDLTLADALQLLRFPKRFSPDGAEGVHRDSLQKFLNRNNLDKMSDRRGYPSWLILRLREKIAMMLDGLKTYEPYSEEYFEKGYFSSGSCAGMKGSNIIDKIEKWDLPYFGRYAYPTEKVKNWPSDVWYAYDANHNAGYSCRLGYYGSEIHIVNKSYKAGRVIAKENVTRGYYMQGFRRTISDTLKKNGFEYLMPSEHQDFNQMLAHVGSETGALATIDLSAASDSIPAGLVREIFPADFISVWDELRSDYFVTPDGKQYTSYIANTSGSPLCFDMEKMVFYALASIAVDLCVTLGGYKPSLCTAMGDDIILPAYAFDTIGDLLDMCGMVMNREKSFGSDSAYRESCGYEAMDGVTTVTTYFPRQTIFGNLTSLPSLLSLHNTLFLKGYYDAAKIVSKAMSAIEGGQIKTRSTLHQYVEYGAVPDLLGFIEIGRERADNSYDPVCQDRTVCVHDCIKEKPLKRVAVSADYRMYQYTQYLINGPQFLDSISQLCGVSTSRMRPTDRISKSGNVVRQDAGRSFK